MRSGRRPIPPTGRVALLALVASLQLLVLQLEERRQLSAAIWTWCCSFLLKSMAFENTKRTSVAKSSSSAYSLAANLRSMVWRSIGVFTIVGYNGIFNATWSTGFAK